MAFTLRFPTVFSALGAIGAAARPTYWGTCARCDRPTAWFTNALRGEYRCTACGRSTLEEPAA